VLAATLKGPQRGSQRPTSLRPHSDHRAPTSAGDQARFSPQTGLPAQGDQRLVWHNHYRLDRTLETVRWEADTISRILGTHTAALLCIHGAHIQGGGLHAQGVAIVPAGLLRDALGDDRVLSHADLELLATAAWNSLRPAA
jgi:hypothetical protein